MSSSSALRAPLRRRPALPVRGAAPPGRSLSVRSEEACGVWLAGGAGWATSGPPRGPSTPRPAGEAEAGEGGGQLT